MPDKMSGAPGILSGIFLCLRAFFVIFDTAIKSPQLIQIYWRPFIMNIDESKSFLTKNFIFLLISNTLLFMSFEMLTPTLPLLAKSIGCNPSQIGLLIGVFTISAMIAGHFVVHFLIL